MSITDFVAWWGAVIATLVLLWDIYKWRHAGPRLTLKARPNMYFSGLSELDGKRLIFVEVSNNGDRPTTITKLLLVYYDGLWALIRRNAQYFLVKNPGIANSLPHKLGVGEEWDGYTFHTDENEQMLQSGYLYVSLCCSYRTRPISARIRPIRNA